MKKNKHAYLIIAHKTDKTFSTLLKMIDDERNDVFVHIDKKNRNFNQNMLTLSKSNLYFVKRHKVSWGSFSLVQAELELIEKATSTNKYTYYHLLSGSCLPIKSQDYIHDYLEDKNIEFIDFDLSYCENFEQRASYHYIFQKLKGRSQNKFFDFVIKLSIYAQRKIRVKRNKNIVIYKGSQWFSITNKLAEHIKSNKNWIIKCFNNTLIPDELFLQTLVKNKPIALSFSNNNNLRLIIWKDKNPIVLTDKHLDQIKCSDRLFARKFNLNKDNFDIHTLESKIPE